MVLIGSDTIPTSCLASAPFLHFLELRILRGVLCWKRKKLWAINWDLFIFSANGIREMGRKTKSAASLRGGDHSA
jgi:hypothetical protein